MNFGDALIRLRDGERVTRDGWNGTGLWVALAGAGLGWGPYLYLETSDGTRVPWTSSQTDVLAGDWRAAGRVASSPKDGTVPLRAVPLTERSDVETAAARVVVAFAGRGDDLYSELLEPMQELDEALDRAGRS